MEVCIIRTQKYKNSGPYAYQIKTIPLNVLFTMMVYGNKYYSLKPNK